MLSIVLTNRNRDLKSVKGCLRSLDEQTSPNFIIFFVDYGSCDSYKYELKKVLEKYSIVRYIDCPTEGQLWNKSRAINIALRAAETPYFLVGDVDIVFSPYFVQEAMKLANPNEVHYFQCGFISREETLTKNNFNEYEVAFIGNKAVTGISLFPTPSLKSINGYDEFYHGWGAEDTDVHNRISHLGLKVLFYNRRLLIKHQWHSKFYRGKFSNQPYHSQLEQINHSYMLLSDKTKRILVNQDLNWGVMPTKQAYGQLNKVQKFLQIKPISVEVKGILAHLKNCDNEVVSLKITDCTFFDKVINSVKRILGRKYNTFYRLDEVNNMLLEFVITNFRNNPYRYSYNKKNRYIQLEMYFKK